MGHQRKNARATPMKGATRAFRRSAFQPVVKHRPGQNQETQQRVAAAGARDRIPCAHGASSLSRATRNASAAVYIVSDWTNLASAIFCHPQFVTWELS